MYNYIIHTNTDIYSLIYTYMLAYIPKNTYILYFSQKHLPENITRTLCNNKARLHFARQLFL